MHVNINWFYINGEDDSLTLTHGPWESLSPGTDFNTHEGNSIKETVEELMNEGKITSTSSINISEEEGYAVVVSMGALGVVAPIGHPINEEINNMRKTINKISKLGNLF